MSEWCISKQLKWYPWYLNIIFKMDCWNSHCQYILDNIYDIVLLFSNHLWRMKNLIKTSKKELKLRKATRTIF